jgi:hypothetical protein
MYPDHFGKVVVSYGQSACGCVCMIDFPPGNPFSHIGSPIAGPCQFPTLGFVVDQYRAKERFVAEDFWKIDGKSSLFPCLFLFPVSADSDPMLAVKHKPPGAAHGAEFTWARSVRTSKAKQ